MIDYSDPTPSAVKIHNSKCKVKAICGPVGSGKTSVCCMEFFLLCWESEVSVYGIVIRSSYRELQDSTRRTFEHWFGDILTYHEKNEQAEIKFPGRDGITRSHYLDFRACRRAQEVTKFMSTEYGFAWLEEVVPAFAGKMGSVMGQGLPKEVLSIALMRVRQPKVPRLQILLTFNPPSTRHWTYKEFFQATPEDLERKDTLFVRQPPGENAPHLEPGYYESLVQHLDPELARRFVGGEPVTLFEGERVFPECVDQVHIVDYLEPVPEVPLTLGVDFGLSPCAVVSQILQGGSLLLLGELQLFNRGIKSFVEHLGPYLQQEFPSLIVRKMWIDPAGNQRSQVDENETCAQVLRQAGYPVENGNNNWTLRREVMKQRFEFFPQGKPGIMINRQTCPMLAEGMLGGYHFQMGSNGALTSFPVKNAYSHVQDATQMIAVGEFSLLTGLLMSTDRVKKSNIKRDVYNPLSETKYPKRYDRYAWMRR